MKKQLTALVLCICMVLSMLPFSGTQTAQADDEETSSVGASNISIGDYISLGTYMPLHIADALRSGAGNDGL